jgi:hypothetical protein
MGVDVIAKNLLEGKTCEGCGYCGRGEDGWFCKANKKKPEENTCVNWDSFETVIKQEAEKEETRRKSIPSPYSPYKGIPWKKEKEQYPWKKYDEEIESGKITWEEEDGNSKLEKYSNTIEKYLKKLHENIEYTQSEYKKFKRN